MNYNLLILLKLIRSLIFGNLLRCLIWYWYFWDVLIRCWYVNIWLKALMLLWEFIWFFVGMFDSIRLYFIMLDHNQNPKKTKNLFSFFKKKNDGSSSSTLPSSTSLSTPIREEQNLPESPIVEPLIFSIFICWNFIYR